MSAADVLNGAADMIEARQRWQREREVRNGAGGRTYSDLFASAGLRCGWPAVVALERHLGAELRTGQLQHWAETDPDRVVEVLRAAAGIPTPVDAETVALRRQWDDLCARLAALVPYPPTGDPDRLVDALASRISQLERWLAEAQARLAKLEDGGRP